MNPTLDLKWGESVLFLALWPALCAILYNYSNKVIVNIILVFLLWWRDAMTIAALMKENI